MLWRFIVMLWCCYVRNVRAAERRIARPHHACAVDETVILCRTPLCI